MAKFSSRKIPASTPDREHDGLDPCALASAGTPASVRGSHVASYVCFISPASGRCSGPAACGPQLWGRVQEMGFTWAAASEPQAWLLPKTTAAENLRNGSQGDLEAEGAWLFPRM